MAVFAWMPARRALLQVVQRLPDSHPYIRTCGGLLRFYEFTGSDAMEAWPHRELPAASDSALTPWLRDFSHSLKDAWRSNSTL